MHFKRSKRRDRIYIDVLSVLWTVHRHLPEIQRDRAGINIEGKIPARVLFDLMIILCTGHIRLLYDCIVQYYPTMLQDLPDKTYYT